MSAADAAATVVVASAAAGMLHVFGRRGDRRWRVVLHRWRRRIPTATGRRRLHFGVQLVVTVVVVVIVVVVSAVQPGGGRMRKV